MEQVWVFEWRTEGASGIEWRIEAVQLLNEMAECTKHDAVIVWVGQVDIDRDAEMPIESQIEADIIARR